QLLAELAGHLHTELHVGGSHDDGLQPRGARRRWMEQLLDDDRERHGAALVLEQCVGRSDDLCPDLGWGSLELLEALTGLKEQDGAPERGAELDRPWA